MDNGERRSLADLFRGGLQAGAQAEKMDARTDEAFVVTEAALSSFRALQGRVDILGLFSTNEEWEDVNSTDAPYLLLPYTQALVMQRQRTNRRLGRLRVIAQAEQLMKGFTKMTDALGMIPDDERKLFGKKGRSFVIPIGDAGKKRELKIKQYQKEKEIKEFLQHLQVRRRPSLTEIPPLESEFDIIATLLPPPRRPDSERFKRGPKDKYANEGEYEDEELLRDAVELVVRLCWARAHQTLQDLHAEKDLLEKAPKDPDEDKEKAEYDARDKQKGKGKADGTWKLDGSRAGTARGALLDSEGKPLRPFVITSSSSSSRSKLQSEVFRPDHRLPTMSIDEYLAEEERRGNIIRDGGAASGQGPTSEEALRIRSEYDGTTDAIEAEVERRTREEYWALYIDEHRRGSGNTLNRG